MNIRKSIFIISMAAVLPVGAQSLSFTNFSLISGADLQEGAQYRFSDVLANVDAIVTLNSFVGNASLIQVDDAAGSVMGADLNAFRPTVRNFSSNPGTAEEGSISFNVAFVTAGTTSSIILDQFGLSVFDTDGNSVDIREFAETNGDFITAGASITVSNPATGVTRVEATDTTVNPGITEVVEFRSDFSFTNASEFDLTFGSIASAALGADPVANDRLNGAFFSGNPAVVPEPTSVLLTGVGMLGFCFHRRRQNK